MRKTMLMKKIAHVASLLDSSGHIQEAKSINLILSKFAEDESVSRERDEPRNFPPPDFMKDVKDGFVNFNLLEELYDYIYKIVGNEHRDSEKYLYHLKYLAQIFQRIEENLKLFNESKSAEERLKLVKEIHLFFKKLIERIEIFEGAFNVNFTEEQQDEIRNVLMFILDDLKKLIENDRNIHESKKMNLTLLKFAEDESVSRERDEPREHPLENAMKGVQPGFANYDIVENLHNLIFSKVGNVQNNDELYQTNLEDVSNMFDVMITLLQIFGELSSKDERRQIALKIAQLLSLIFKRLEIFEVYFKVHFDNQQIKIMDEIAVSIMEDLVEKVENHSS